MEPNFYTTKINNKMIQIIGFTFTFTFYRKSERLKIDLILLFKQRERTAVEFNCSLQEAGAGKTDYCTMPRNGHKHFDWVWSYAPCSQKNLRSILPCCCSLFLPRYALCIFIIKFEISSLSCYFIPFKLRYNI